MSPPDKITQEYLSGRCNFREEQLVSDPDAVYSSWRTYDVRDLVPQVAVPHNVDQVG